MKIKISYKLEEEKNAGAAVVALLRVLPGAKVRKSDRHAPFIHTYLTTQKSEGEGKSCGNN